MAELPSRQGLRLVPIGPREALTLREFRERLDGQPGQSERSEWGACLCMEEQV